ncbi:MAG TPA: class I SAM-dependent methyltransferase [Gemmatimonadales bacterium]|nr:class I SAM-dependent methyltransferase [Gemmatimonadales bacterium]
MNLDAWRPYESAMSAYHRGQHDATIVVYDDYERDEAPLSYFFRQPSQFPQLELTALGHCRGRVLDVGAGSGCHALALQQRGLSVTALEILPGLVEILRQRGVRDVREMTWMDLRPEEPFDTVLMMMNGLGLAETLAGLDGFFRDARRLVKKDGQVLADSTDVRVRMDPDAARTGTLQRPDGRYIGELHFQLEFQGRKGPPFAQLYVDPETLQAKAKANRWGCEMLHPPDQYGNYLVRLTP